MVMSLVPSLLQNVDVVAFFTRKRLRVQIPAVRWKPGVVSVGDAPALRSVWRITRSSAGGGALQPPQALWINVRHALSSCWNNEADVDWHGLIASVQDGDRGGIWHPTLWSENRSCAQFLFLLFMCDVRCCCFLPGYFSHSDVVYYSVIALCLFSNLPL